MQPRVRGFATARDFLHCKPRSPGCLVLDLRSPGLSGLDLQRELARADVQIPVIFATGHGDIPPFDDLDLVNAIQQAVERDRLVQQEHKNQESELERAAVGARLQVSLPSIRWRKQPRLTRTSSEGTSLAGSSSKPAPEPVKA